MKIVADALDATFLQQGLSEEAKEKRGLAPAEPFSFFLCDDGKAYGGITGFLVYGALHIDTLYIDKAYRGKGWGSALVEKAEMLAKERGCSFAMVGTMDWEAGPFYEKLGFTKLCENMGYQKNSKLIVFRKEF